MALCFYLMDITSILENIFLLFPEQSLLSPVSTFLFLLVSGYWKFLQRSNDSWLCVFQYEAVRCSLEVILLSMLGKRAVEWWASFRGTGPQPCVPQGERKHHQTSVIVGLSLGPFSFSREEYSSLPPGVHA